MDHSTIKLNDERLKFVTALSSSNTDFFYEFPTEPDLDKLKVWFMLDHLGAELRDMSGFGNNAIIRGHPTLRRASLNLGFQQTSAAFGTPVMLFNSGTDIVSQFEGEYIEIADNPSIQFTNPLHNDGFSIAFRFNCLNFVRHAFGNGGLATRRFAAKTDSSLTGHDVTTATDGWSISVNTVESNPIPSNNGIVFQVVHDGVEYQKRAVGFSTNTWYQVVVTYNPNVTASDRIKMYVGGNLTGSTTNLTLFLPMHPNLRIGTRDATSGFFQGYLHDFRIYMDKILTQTEIDNLDDNEITIDNIQKGHIFVVQYAMVSQAMKSKKHIYDMDGRIKRGKIHKYNVIQLVNLLKTHKYGLLHDISLSRTHKFNILKLVTMSKTHVYDEEGVIKSFKTHKYNTLQKVTKSKTHVYSIGGLQTQYQRFTKSTTAGSNITQEVTFDSTPQAIIVWSDGSTSDNTFSDGYHTYYGFSDGTHHACVSGISLDNLGTTDTFSGHKDDRVISLMNTTVASMVAEATVSFANSKATFNWTTNDNRAVYIHCLAFFGLNNVEVKTFTAGTTTNGTRVYSLNNSSMTPTLVHAITRGGGGVNWTNTIGQSISIGAGRALTPSGFEQFTVTNLNDDASGTSDTVSIYETTNFIAGYNDDTEVQEMSGALNAVGTGTFTVNWTNAPTVSTAAFSVLVFDSANVDIGIITQPASTGSQVTNTASNVDTVKGIMMFSNGLTTADTWGDSSDISIGGASINGASTISQGVIASSDLDGADPTVTARINKTGSITKMITAAATATSSTTQNEAAVTAMGTDQFTLNWTTIANSTARKHHYIVWGKT